MFSNQKLYLSHFTDLVFKKPAANVCLRFQNVDNTGWSFMQTEYMTNGNENIDHRLELLRNTILPFKNRKNKGRIKKDTHKPDSRLIVNN